MNKEFIKLFQECGGKGFVIWDKSLERYKVYLRKPSNNEYLGSEQSMLDAYRFLWTVITNPRDLVVIQK